MYLPKSTMPSLLKDRVINTIDNTDVNIEDIVEIPAFLKILDKLNEFVSLAVIKFRLFFSQLH